MKTFSKGETRKKSKRRRKKEKKRGEGEEEEERKKLAVLRGVRPLINAQPSFMTDSLVT